MPTPTLVDVVQDNRGIGRARYITFRVLMDEDESAAIMRAAGCTTDALPTVLRDEILGTVSALIDHGKHGMTTDELIARGDIEVGRRSLA